MTFTLRKELSNYSLEKKIDQIRPEEQLPWQPKPQSSIDVLYPHLASWLIQFRERQSDRGELSAKSDPTDR